MTTTPEKESLERRRVLRGSIKLLLSIGVLFLLVPFFRSIPWPESPVPGNSTPVNGKDLDAGVAQSFELQDGSTVFVTRLDDAVRHRLQSMPADRFWYPTAPGLLSGDYVAVQARTVLDEPVSWLPPEGEWPGGFHAPSGALWDVAGRALKPLPGQPGSPVMKFSNLMPAPFQAREDTVLLIPLPARQPDTESSE